MPRRRATRTPQELEELERDVQDRAQRTQANSASPVLDSPRGATANPQDSNRDNAMEELLRRLANSSTEKNKFKAPKFGGDSDAELFISNFQDVADANNWSPRDTTLHLRACLEGPAVECGRGQTPDEIITSLRGRYGLTSRQARDKLDQIKRASKQNLHDYGNEITKLVKIAYPDQDQAFCTRTAIEKFQKGLNNTQLQQHMLTIPHPTMAEAIRVADEYLQIETKATVNVVKTEVESEMTPSPAQPDKMDLLLKAIEGLIAAQTTMLTNVNKPIDRATPRVLGPCYHCGIRGHLKKECRKLKAEQEAAATTNQSAGNESGPAQ